MNGLKRKLIGRFGIGKLSLYQICNSFEIETWRDEILSKATFDFGGFEREEFIENFSLDVKSAKTDIQGSGTRLTLHGIKMDINSRKLRMDLQRTMPLTNDFKVVLMGKGFETPLTLRSEDMVSGSVHEIDENVNGLGKVHGKIVYKKTESGEHGVYIRVFGRLVNLDNPHGIINFPGLSHARQFMRKIHAELHVDGLNEALQTNRAGFVVEHPAYKSFLQWVKKKLNRLNEVEYKEWKNVKEKMEAEQVPEVIDVYLSTIDRNLKSELVDSGEKGPEAVYDKNKVIVNVSHPMYITAKEKGKTWGMLYHSMKSVIIAVALKKSRTLKDFEKHYNKMNREVEELMGAIKFGRGHITVPSLVERIEEERVKKNDKPS